MRDAWTRGDWMQTASGKQFYPFDPTLDSIDIDDIAHALAMTNRYGGHTLFPYPVAQHSVLVASKAPPEYALAALMHDAPEAYIGDLVYPVKKHEAMQSFRSLEHTIEMAIAAKFNLPWPFITPEIKALDTRILADERQQVMKHTEHHWYHMGDPLGVTIEEWTWQRAKSEFLSAFEEYSKWQSLV